MTTRKLYELAGSDPARLFSPFCWRVRLALAHKGLEFDSIPWRFTDKEVIAFSGQGLVPVLVDGDKVVSDSWEIASYLEDAYPEKPSVFGGDGGRGAARFVASWTEGILHPLISKMMAKDICDVIADKDKPYFRESREKRYNMTLEQWVSGREARIPEFRGALLPLRNMLSKQPFIGGSAPSYSDYIVFSAFLWARGVSESKLLEKEDVVYEWRERMMDLFDGMARKFVGFDV